MERAGEASRFQMRFQIAVEMAETGVRLMRQNLRRQDPAASEAEIDARLRRWLRGRPMDADGRPRPPTSG